MTATERAAYDEGFREALEVRDSCAADEWDEKVALERHAAILERRCDRLRAALWGAAGIAAGLALAALALWAES